jgi:hypothetical protein
MIFPVGGARVPADFTTERSREFRAAKLRMLVRCGRGFVVL